MTSLYYTLVKCLLKWDVKAHGYLWYNKPTMAHNVIVGGFASGKKQVEKVAYSLAAYHDEDFEGISFREAMTDRDRLDRITRGARVITHSAGMVAMKDMRPKSIDAIAPPVPVWAPFLAARAVASTVELAAGNCIPWQEADEVGGCLRNGTEELLVHLHGNMRWLGHIASFNALRAGVAAHEAGITAGLAFMNGDVLFQPHKKDVAWARKVGLYVVTVAGAHEEFIRRPTSVFSSYEEGGEVVAQPDTAMPISQSPLVAGA